MASPGQLPAELGDEEERTSAGSPPQRLSRKLTVKRKPKAARRQCKRRAGDHDGIHKRRDKRVSW